MNTRYILLFLFCLILASCGEDRRLEYAERTNLTHWIYDTMEDYYLWYDILEEKKSGLNYYQRPETFLASLFSPNDKNFSSLETPEEEEQQVATRSVVKDRYGFEFQTAVAKKGGKHLYARVLYVNDGSPASDAGLVRGEWIFTINGRGITQSGVDSLRSGKEAILETGRTQYTEEGLIPMEVQTKTLSPSRSFEQNPVLFHDTFVRNGNRIGYLVYNSFVSGKGDSDTDETYLNELGALSNYFKSQDVNEFILDLRYNSGGELNRPVPLITTVLAPASAIGEVMGYTVFNDKHQEMNGEIKFSAGNLYGGSNLDLDRVFILVNKEFTASASEAVINFLKPYTDVQLIGTGTIGKNVGSQKFVYEADPRYVLHPIVCTLENSEHKSDYGSSGFAIPQENQVSEKDSTQMYPFGETDLLVVKALEIIENATPAPEVRSAGSLKLNTVGNSLERKFRPAAIIR